MPELVKGLIAEYEAVPSIVDVQPGDIFLSRTFDTTKGTPNSNVDISGHTAIVLDVQHDIVITLGFNRNMPVIDGFGIQELPLSPTLAKNEVKIMFQRRVKL